MWGEGSGDAGSSALFAVSAIMAILGQIRLTAWAKNRWSAGRSLTVGLGLMGGAFVPLILTAHLSVADGPLTPARAMLSLAPTLLATILLTLGTVLAYPFEMDTIVTLSGGRLVATHYGFYNTLSGIGITVGNLATGLLWDLGRAWEVPALVWIALGHHRAHRHARTGLAHPASAPASHRRDTPTLTSDGSTHRRRSLRKGGAGR